MELIQLLAVQSSGALKSKYDPATGTVKVGGIELNKEQCQSLVSNLGWLEYSKQPHEIIEKTEKFAKALNSYLDNEEIINGTTITFQNKRRMGTEKYFDRIKITGDGLDLTILYNMPGTGGAYAVYDGTDGNRQPVYTCRSMKQLCEYLNEEV